MLYFMRHLTSHPRSDENLLLRTLLSKFENSSYPDQNLVLSCKTKVTPPALVISTGRSEPINKPRRFADSNGIWRLTYLRMSLEKLAPSTKFHTSDTSNLHNGDR
jgi:hypothetical protein